MCTTVSMPSKAGRMASKSEMEACVFLTSPLGLNLSQAPLSAHPTSAREGTHFQSSRGERLRALNSYLFSSFVTMSPPITTAVGAFAGKTAYCISKFGMTMCALGAAAEGRGRGVTGNSLWPATVIESLAAINFKLGDKSQWRKATILADAVVEICESGDDFSGNMLIDDDFLRSRGWSDADIARYRVDPDVEPPRLLAGDAEGQEWGGDFKRGDVRKVDHDIGRSKL